MSLFPEKGRLNSLLTEILHYFLVAASLPAIDIFQMTEVITLN